MPEHWMLQVAAAWLKDLAAFCAVAKPALLAITEFVLFLVGLITVVRLAVGVH